MNQLKKMVVSVLAVVSAGVLCAGESTWAGAAGDNGSTADSADKPDAFLDCVVFTNTQYVDTGIRGRTGTKVDISFAIDFKSGSDWTIIGSRKDDNGRFMIVHYYNNKFRFGYRTVSKVACDQDLVAGRVYRFVSDFSTAGKARCGLNGGEMTEHEIDGSFDSERSMWLGAANYGSPNYSVAGKLYACKIWQDDGNGGELKLVRDYQPCVKDGVAGLYDRVSGTIFYSNGKSPLVKGPNEYAVDFSEPDAYVEWLEADGEGQCIDTGIVGRDGTSVDIDFDPRSLRGSGMSTDTAILACRDNGNHRFYPVYEYQNYWVYGYGALKEKLGFDDSTPKAVAKTRTRIEATLKAGEQVVKLNGRAFTKIDGSDWTSKSESESYDTKQTMWLFANNYQGQTTAEKRCYSNTRVYSLRIWQDGALVRDYVPCVKGGQAGLYDRASKCIFYSASETPFDPATQAGAITNAAWIVDGTRPEKRLAFVESDGVEDFIDTGVVGKTGTKTELDMEFVTVPSDNTVLGSRNGNERFYCCHYWKGFGIGYGATADSTFRENVTAGTQYRIVTELASGAQSVHVDFRESGAWQTFANKTWTVQDDVDTGFAMYLFGLNKDGALALPTKIRVRRLKIWQDGALVRDFRPVLCNGIALLWDKVGERFYPNSGRYGLVAGPVSGDFDTGAVILLR